MEEQARISSIEDSILELFGNSLRDADFLIVYRDNKRAWYLKNHYNGALFAVVEKGTIKIRKQSMFLDFFKEKIVPAYGLKLVLLDNFDRYRVRYGARYFPAFEYISFNPVKKVLYDINDAHNQ